MTENKIIGAQERNKKMDEMKITKCLQCGGDLKTNPKTGVPTCIYCGREYKDSVGSYSYDLQEIVNRRQMREFIQAEELCKELLRKQPESSEVYWQTLLSTLGVVYVQEEGRVKPTFFSYTYDDRELIQDNEYYKKAIMYARSSEDREFYQTKAKELDVLLKEFFKLVAKEDSYDIFISFKKSTEATVGGEIRTIDTDDYKKAKEIYEHLTKLRYRVFFSPVSIGADTGIEGEKYEPRILKALQSSQAMILIGTRKEYLESQWVENEWKRYLYYISKGKKTSNSLMLGYEKNMPQLPTALKDIQWPNFDVYKGNYLAELESKLAFVKRQGVREQIKNEGHTDIDKELSITKKRGSQDPIKSKFRTKLKTVLISTVCILLVVGCIFGGMYKNGMNAVNETIELIDYLPDTINEYSYFEDLIVQSYESYSALADWQKGKVTNRDKFLSILAPYNEYKVQNLCTTAEAVSVDTAGTTTVLADTVELYQKLTIEQKQLLTTEEISKFDSYVKVQDTITLINQINDDLVNKYDQVNEARKLYYSISQEYTALVYNYSLVDTFTDKLAFYELFTFEELEGGTYSIRVKDPESLSGTVELPAKYNGQDVTTIPEGAFKDCKNVTSFVVPNTVMQIGCGAFQGCKKLESISLPFTGHREDSGAYNAVFGYIFGYTTQIDWTVDRRVSGSSNNFMNEQISTVDGAIWQYTAQNALGKTYYYPQSYFYYIPASLAKVTITRQTEIKVAAFNGCTNVTQINYVNDLTGVNYAAFQSCESLVSLNSDIEGHADLTGEYTTIGGYALKDCEKISQITIPDGIYTINEYAFSNTAVESVIIPDTVESIYVGAFKGCNNLQEMQLPIIGKNSNATAYEAVFGYIFGYEDGSVYGYGDPANYTVDWNTDYRQSTPSNAFINRKIGFLPGTIWQYSAHNHLGTKYYYPQSYNYYIPESLKRVIITKQTIVPVAAFNGCTMLTDITFTKGIESQGECAFQNCTATIYDGMK